MSAHTVHIFPSAQKWVACMAWKSVWVLLLRGNTAWPFSQFPLPSSKTHTSCKLLKTMNHTASLLHVSDVGICTQTCAPAHASTLKRGGALTSKQVTQTQGWGQANGQPLSYTELGAEILPHSKTSCKKHHRGCEEKQPARKGTQHIKDQKLE